jgi:hypothetical protein
MPLQVQIKGREDPKAAAARKRIEKKQAELEEPFVDIQFNDTQVRIYHQS